MRCLMILGLVCFLSACNGQTPDATDVSDQSDATTHSEKIREVASNVVEESETAHGTPAEAGNSGAEITETVPAAVSPDAPAKPGILTAEEIQAGWISLFDGQSLFGWKKGSETNWTVKDGVIVADEGAVGLLCTTTDFADYELRCDFRLEKGGNSGVFLHTVLDPMDPSKDCYELNICDNHPAFPTGSIVALQKPEKTVEGEGDWKTFHVTVIGSKITVKLDGEQILDFHDERSEALRHGLIGLQKNAGKAEYRNIFLRPLSTKPLFNGEDLAGWRVVPGGKSEFTVEDGAIHIVNGRGYLETEKTWDDFVLQAEILSNGKYLNSGIFFRAIEGTESNPADGYECQVRNEWKGDDRNQPVDFGTGGIYRRIATRRVVSSDFEWFTMTLVARGPHMSVWVNGEMVTDWIDEREPNPNPRQGLRLEAGHFSLQGHDPTTDLSFRNIRLAEYPGETNPKQ